MTLGFLDHMRVVPDRRIPEMVTYPLDEILLVTLAGVVCGADDREGVEEIATGGFGLASRVSAVCERHPEPRRLCARWSAFSTRRRSREASPLGRLRCAPPRAR